MTPLPPVLLLPGALADPLWLGPDIVQTLAQSPGWRMVCERVQQVQATAPSDDALPEPGHERWLQSRFGLPDTHPFPACAVTRLGDDRPAWRLDLVHLHLGRDHLVLTDPGLLRIDAHEKAALAESIVSLFAEEGLELGGIDQDIWSLTECEPARPLQLRTRSLMGALGRSIDGYLPQGADARRWRRLLNEVQMTWHIHPVNEARELRGQATVNSLWLEGPAPTRTLMPDARQRAAAAHLSNPAVVAPRTDASMHGSRSVDDGKGLIAFDDRLLRAQFSGDPHGFRSAWLELDRTVFAAIATREAPWQSGAVLVLTGDSGWRSLTVSKDEPSLLRRALARLRSSATLRSAHARDWLAPINTHGPR